MGPEMAPLIEEKRPSDTDVGASRTGADVSVGSKWECVALNAATHCNKCNTERSEE